MKNLYLFLLITFSTLYTQAQNQPFITTWEVPANDLSITIPTHSGSTYNYTVDFGDGTVLTNQTGDATHTYNSAGTYTVSITGTFPRIYYDSANFDTRDKFIEINQWGDIQWQSMESAFKACHNLIINALDAPDLSQVTDLSSMFALCINFNQSINHWDVSNITNMTETFYHTNSFNQPLNNWDMSNVTNLGGMFKDADSFNQPLNNWDMSNVTNISAMFSGATSFNQPLNNWNTSNVIIMTSIFYGAYDFNQPLNNWDVSNVTMMFYAFYDAASFDQPLNSWNITTQYLNGFLDNSGMSIYNYDNFLSHLVSLDIEQGELGVDFLEYCNTSARDELINNQSWNIIGDIQSQNCNSISGEITYDENNNGCDPNDTGISGFRVNANDGTDDIFTYSNNGDYQLGTIGTNFIVSVMNYPSYFSVTPASQQVTFTTSNTEVADFCVTANQSIENLNVVLIPTSEARPGFEADYQLVVENIGTQTLANATVTLDFDDAMQSFVSASVTPTSTTANQLTFDMANLQPLTFQTVDITMQTFQPPTVNGDDILSFTANVSPSVNDFTPNDNTFMYDQTVVNSYDPNDKQVLQGEEIEIDEADEYLNYLIRFQNTGTASAINVRILDTLHPKLDYSTLRPVNASHNYRIEVNNENEVEFIFDGINLPDENTNEPASHGFVAYKIKPKSDVAVGDFITGDANIYFDFNAPIITNMVSTEIIDDLNSTSYELENGISIYPNPTQNILHIDVKNNQKIEKLKIYNLSGLELLNVKENKQKLNLESLSAGVYFIQIQTNLGTVNKRFIKK
jgi:surface protein